MTRSKPTAPAGRRVRADTPSPTHARRRWTLLCSTVALCSLLGAGAPAPAGASPPRGSPAPPITLKDLDGTTVSTEKLAPRALVLIFGELTHEGIRQTCENVLDALADPRLTGDSVVPILIVAQDAPVAKLKEEAAQGHFPALILHDPKRDAFGAYRVLVVPTVVVVDGKGTVVHAMPGFLPRFKDVLIEALLLSAGKESPQAFEQVIDPKAEAVVPHEVVRADRLAHLGVELTRHGLYDMAAARFGEAISLVPAHTGAKLGLAELLLRQDKFSESEPLFRSVLATSPDAIEASLGIAALRIKRATGDDTAQAEASLRALIEKSPSQPRGRYLLGRICEGRGDLAAAAAEYRKAAESMLDR